MRVLVSGGTGFLGKRLAETLQRLGYQVTAIGRNKNVGHTLKSIGVNFIQCDLTNKQQMIQCCANQDYVFHCGALSASWGEYEAFYETNVNGTKHIIEGCQHHKVKRLIHVSTPSIYATNKDRLNVTELASLPKKKVNAYAETKYEAEREIDHAFKEGLPVITIRPRAIFGPDDPNILPRLISANEQGRLPLISGGQALIDVTYIDNVVDALIKCMNSPEFTLGRKYNITNGEPMPFITLVEQLFTALNKRLNSRKIPFTLAYSVANILEWKAKLTRSKQEPVLTRSTVGMLGRSLTLDIAKAKQELNYDPRITVADGIEAYVASLKHI